MRLSRLAVLAALAALASTDLQAAECSRPDALGTARTLVVDAASHPRVGLKSFPQTLPLADKEVVLTFDDGPFPPTTKLILAALAQECVRATFFMIGESAAGSPDLVRRMAAAGHTIAHHTWSHAHLNKLPTAAAVAQIDRGIKADDAALYGTAGPTPATPFFRFPYFESTPALLDLLQARGIVVFGADFWASDWEVMQPQQQLNLIIERLKVARKGIILFHDTKPQTAAMLPDFLKYLRDNQYRVVHIVAAPRDKLGARLQP
jgi:peptidoglycan/xylan/chitin deacetylase (PgdA/CDA1 family)